jgi:hypothetical protein
MQQMVVFVASRMAKTVETVMMDSKAVNQKVAISKTIASFP